MKSGIILDRDGTLIDFYRDAALGVVTPAFHSHHVRFLPGVIDGLTLLRDAGFVFAVATNQPDAAKGRLPLEAIERTNAALVSRLADAEIEIAQVERCPHYPTLIDGGNPALSVACDCRKPKPGMLLRIIEGLDLDPATTWMIGDTVSDLGASAAAGIRFGLLMQIKRCELCVLPTIELDGAAPTLAAPRIDELAQMILER